MAKRRNLKKEKALRNQAYARKFRKRSNSGRFGRRQYNRQDSSGAEGQKEEDRNSSDNMTAAAD